MRTHTVQPGERLSAIAAHYRVPVTSILDANPTKARARAEGGATVFASLSAGEDIALPATCTGLLGESCQDAGQGHAFLGATQGAMMTNADALQLCMVGNVAWGLAQMITAPAPIIDLIVFFGGRLLADAVCAYWFCLADDHCSDFLRSALKEKFLSGGIASDFMSGSSSFGDSMTDEERYTTIAGIITESLAEASAATLPNVTPGPPPADPTPIDPGTDPSTNTPPPASDPSGTPGGGSASGSGATPTVPEAAAEAAKATPWWYVAGAVAAVALGGGAIYLATRTPTHKRAANPVERRFNQRSFTFIGGSSAKYWEIAQRGSVVTVHFGRINTLGQVQRKDLGSKQAAKKHVERLILEKLSKGYEETAQTFPAS